jgi:metal-dependent HD superfamily phosphatase/phosphodiesterase
LITFQDIRNDPQVRAYIQKADEVMGAMGFTEHSFAHAGRTAETAAMVLLELEYSERDAELARIAGFMHDIGNAVNRDKHAQSGALLAARILHERGMDPAEEATIAAAIGHHDEESGSPVHAIAAALILADKSDVRRSRVRLEDNHGFDIHDRVNYAVEKARLEIVDDKKIARLSLQIDTSISSVVDYFEIFLQRMLMCRRACDYLNIVFELYANGIKVM